jgi:hypothetical protein
LGLSQLNIRLLVLFLYTNWLKNNIITNWKGGKMKHKLQAWLAKAYDSICGFLESRSAFVEKRKAL